MIIIEAVLMGSFATVFMDVFAGFLAKRKVITPFIDTESIGRWFLYMFRGKFIHADILKTPRLKNEKMWSNISHYLIGIVLAGVFLVLEVTLPIVGNHIWIALAFGIATVLFPWFWMLPSIGLGVLASKSPVKRDILKTNLINHTNFGIGLFLWVLVFHRFFV